MLYFQGKCSASSFIFVSSITPRAFPARTACGLRAHSFQVVWKLVFSSYPSAGHSYLWVAANNYPRSPLPIGMVLSSPAHQQYVPSMVKPLPFGNRCGSQRDEGEGTNKASCEETKLVLNVQARCWDFLDIYVCWQIVWLEILSPNSIKT